MDVKDIIEGCKKNNRASQKDLYDQFKKALFAICLRYSYDTAQAEDFLHDSFITIFTKIKQYKNKGSFEAWMKRIAVNTCIAYLRKKKEILKETLNGNIENEEDYTEANLDNPEVLLKYLQKLPPKSRLIFNLYVLDGYTHKEIAKELKISIGTSKSQYAYARKKLQNMIIRDKEII